MKKVRRQFLIIITIIVFLFLAAKTVYALYQVDYSLTNDFTVSSVNIDIEEMLNINTWPNSTTFNQVTVVNQESSPVIVRVMYTEIWKYNNQIINNIINGENVVIKGWRASFQNDWTYHNGWYYYNKVLAGNDSTTILDMIQLNTNLVNGDPKYLNGEYNLTFHYEGVQASTSAVNRLWGHTITINGENIQWSF